MNDKRANEGIAVQESDHKGHILKQARETQGLSLENVHEATKIPMDALRAIEEGYKIKILTEFYYKSFVKIYAKHLGVDAGRVLGQEEKVVIKPRPVEKYEDVNFNILETINRKLTKERKRQILYVLGALLCCWLVFKLASFLVQRKPKEVKAPPAQTLVDRAERSLSQDVDLPSGQAPDVVEVAPVSAAAVVEPSQDRAAVSSVKNVVLTVRARKESWLRVKADGDVIFQSTLKAGDVETWDAHEQIEITGRNISELEFEHNGKMIGTLGRASRRAKGLVVTKAGLSVTK